MTEFIFICGKNFSVSAAEIVSCLEAGKIGFKVSDYSDEFIAVESEELPGNITDNLGGTLKTAKVVFSSKNKNIKKIKKEIAENMDFDRLFSGLPARTVFGVSSYRSRKEYIILSKFFREKMKDAGINAKYIHLPNDRSSLIHVEVIKKHLIDKYIELLACSGKQFYIGKTTGVHNPFEFQKRDMERPVQRTMYSIPPRLSRIMINLSMFKKGVLVDAFCGIGGILQEAALISADIYGIDNDRECVEGCIKNLRWLSGEYHIEIKNIENKIRAGDARKLSSYFAENSVDAIVSEPNLGPPLKERPDYETAKRIIESLNPLYGKAVSEMVKILKPKKRIVITSPVFMVKEKPVGIDMNEISGKNGCLLIDPLREYGISHKFPLMDYEERHNTLRQINVMEKL